MLYKDSSKKDHLPATRYSSMEPPTKFSILRDPVAGNSLRSHCDTGGEKMDNKWSR